MEPFSLSRALLLGSRTGVPDEALYLLERTGLLHLLSVSGWHMALAAGVAGGSSFLWRKALPPRWAIGFQAVTSLGFLFFLAHQSGWSKPATRAFSAWALLTLARSLGMRPGIAWTFAVSLAASWALGNGSWVSFLLSAVGMGAILTALGRKRRVWVIFAPWLATLPLVAILFHSAALLAPVYNALATILLGSAVTIPAFGALLWESLGGASPGLWSLADLIGMTALEWLAQVEEILGGGRWVPLPLAILGPVLGAVWILPWGARLRWGGTVLALGGFLFSSWHCGAAVMNVGHGSAVAVAQGPYLVDAGPEWNGRARATQRWAGLSGKGREGILVTHPDRDHAGGLGAMLLRFGSYQGVWLSWEHVDLPNALPLLAAVERYGARVRLWEVEGFPWECAPGPGGTSNNTSPLCRITLESGRTLLLTGDIDRRAERHHLRENQELVSTDYLLVAHHGSRYGSSEEFLEATGARVALISARKQIHPEVLDRLREMKIRITREEGDLIVR
ncbi:MAG: ComEC/Rec2 family competence protein [Bdellovibrionales bacterium]|nr:ComEC/Rec2 family competence protein [Bdellovibrionales bacterium]